MPFFVLSEPFNFSPQINLLKLKLLFTVYTLTEMWTSTSQSSTSQHFISLPDSSLASTAITDSMGFFFYYFFLLFTLFKKKIK